MSDVAGNLKMVKQLFCSSSVSCAQYKAQVASAAAVRLYWCHFILPLGSDRKDKIFIFVAVFSIKRTLLHQTNVQPLRLSQCT